MVYFCFFFASDLKTFLLTSVGLFAFCDAEEDKKFWENLLTLFDETFRVLWRYHQDDFNAGYNQVLECIISSFLFKSMMMRSDWDKLNWNCGVCNFPGVKQQPEADVANNIFSKYNFPNISQLWFTLSLCLPTMPSFLKIYFPIWVF